LVLAAAGCLAAAARADNPMLLPDLGRGNPETLVWIGPDAAQLLVFSFPAGRQRNLGEQVISSGNFDERSLSLLYPQRSGPLVGLDLQHCFPFGDGRGFLTRSGFVHGNPEARKQSGTVKESAEDQPDFVLLNVENGVIVPVVTSGASVRAQFGLEADCRFLGAMEGTVFYWKRAEKDAIRGRDLKTGTVVRWKVPHISLALGVLRGTEKDFGFVVYRDEILRGEKSLIEVSRAEAAREP
jgi:hypothetical protein